MSVSNHTDTSGNFYVKTLQFEDYENRITIGFEASAAGDNSLAIGPGSTTGAGATSSSAIGEGASVGINCISSIALGNSVACAGSNSVAIGSSAGVNTGSDGSVSIGTTVDVYSDNSVCIGSASTARGASTVCIGENCIVGNAASSQSILLGSANTCNNAASNKSILIGNNHNISVAGGVAIGTGVTVTSPSAIGICGDGAGTLTVTTPTFYVKPLRTEAGAPAPPWQAVKYNTTTGEFAWY